MATSNLNIRIDDDLKNQANNFTYPEHIPSDKLLKAIHELENGQTTIYDSLDDFVKAFK